MKERVISRIGSEGPLPFDAFMEMCLYDHEEGFYGAGRVRPGEQSDFLTAPEISPWFGRLLGRWAAKASNGDDVLVEVGSGSGSLLEPLLEEVADRFSQVYAVEASPRAREEISGRVAGVETVAGLDDVPSGGRSVVIANELLDNLPFKLADRHNDEWLEYRIADLDGTLTMELRRDEDLSAWCDRQVGDVPAGVLMTAQIEAARWITDTIDHFGTVRMCLIDYAATTSELARRPRNDVVRTYHGHRTGFDFLTNPGVTDITTDVNIDTIVRAARSMGAAVTVTDQGSFLRGLGAGEILEQLTERGHEHAAAGDTMGQLVARSETTNLRALLDPDGLGGFTVFQIEAGT